MALPSVQKNPKKGVTQGNYYGNSDFFVLFRQELQRQEQQNRKN